MRLALTESEIVSSLSSFSSLSFLSVHLEANRNIVRVNRIPGGGGGGFQGLTSVSKVDYFII